MKKYISVLSILLFIFCLTACGNKKEDDVLHLGVNAIITEIDATNQRITVKDYDIEDDLLGSKCTIDCSEVPLIYCDYDTGDVESINFKDLQIDDEIILSIRSSEIQRRKSIDSVSCEIEVEQIQLGTQRNSQKNSEVKETIEGSMKTYYKMEDGTWKCNDYNYKYRLEVKGRMPNADKDSVYVYLSNIEDISFGQAWKASGLSSNMDDYFDIEDAVLVEFGDE